MLKIHISTKKQCQLIDITGLLEEKLADAGNFDGIFMVHNPHTTAGLTINENADPTVRSDMLMGLEKIIPFKGPYAHLEGNSPAHIKASLMGSSLLIILERGKIQLGTWQGVFFCEFDGPRDRTIWIRKLGE